MWTYQRMRKIPQFALVSIFFNMKIPEGNQIDERTKSVFVCGYWLKINLSVRKNITDKGAPKIIQLNWTRQTENEIDKSIIIFAFAKRHNEQKLMLEDTNFFFSSLFLKKWKCRDYSSSNRIGFATCFQIKPTNFHIWIYLCNRIDWFFLLISLLLDILSLYFLRWSFSFWGSIVQLDKISQVEWFERWNENQCSRLRNSAIYVVGFMMDFSFV